MKDMKDRVVMFREPSEVTEADGESRIDHTEDSLRDYKTNVHSSGNSPS